MNPDEILDNADWTKRTWDLPFTEEEQLERYLRATGRTMEQWEELPVSRSAPWLERDVSREW